MCGKLSSIRRDVAMVRRSSMEDAWRGTRFVVPTWYSRGMKARNPGDSSWSSLNIIICAMRSSYVSMCP